MRVTMKFDDDWTRGVGSHISRQRFMSYNEWTRVHLTVHAARDWTRKNWWREGNRTLVYSLGSLWSRRVNGTGGGPENAAANLLNAIQYVRLMAYVDQLTKCNTCTAAFSGNHPIPGLDEEQERLRGFFPALTDTCKVGDHAAQFPGT
jgi:hypothetical protein